MTVRHNAIYTVLLLLLGLLTVFGVIVIQFITIPLFESRGAYAVVSLRVIVPLYSALAGLMFVTLICRRFFPSAGRSLTKCVNILIMYFYLPVGTVLGIYGLWKVDRWKQSSSEPDKPSEGGKIDESNGKNRER